MTGGRGAAALALVALGTLGCASRAQRVGPTVVEILPVYLGGGAIQLLRPRDAPSWQQGFARAEHPHELVRRSVAAWGAAPIAVHSTSWRWEARHLVLTYLAVIAPPVRPPPGFEAIPAAPHALARGAATRPPVDVAVGAVVTHALQHLCWLTLDDPAIVRALHGGWAEALAPFRPRPFATVDELPPPRPLEGAP